MSGSKAPLTCVWHEEQLYTADPVPQNGAGGLADEKPWISILLSWNGFTMLTRLTFLAFGLSINIPSWLIMCMALQHLSTRPT